MKECLELSFTEMSLLGENLGVGGTQLFSSHFPSHNLEMSPFLDKHFLNFLFKPNETVSCSQVRLWRHRVK